MPVLAMALTAGGANTPADARARNGTEPLFVNVSNGGTWTCCTARRC